MTQRQASLRIVMISDQERDGGAAVAASRLATGLCDAAHNVVRIVRFMQGASGSWATNVLQSNVSSTVSRVAGLIASPMDRQKRARRHLLGSLRESLESIRPDIISIQNIHGAYGYGWSSEMARVCCDIAPTIWTLHDMWSFTGRCTYNYECRRFISGCDSACPTAHECPAVAPQHIFAEWKARRLLYQDCADLVAVAPSKWLAAEAKAGLWHAHRVAVIPNGLPLAVYRPLDKAMAREALDLPGGAPLLLAAAHNWEERRKGGAYLAEALRGWDQGNLTLVLMGNGTAPVLNPRVRVVKLGFLTDERMKVLAYNAADVFVHPAPVDNLPNVVMESIACGTPVASFAVGGLSDMVRPGVSGWLATEVSGAALNAMLKLVLQEIGKGQHHRESARRLAEAEYGDREQALAYTSLFGDMLNEQRAKAQRRVAIR